MIYYAIDMQARQVMLLMTVLANLAFSIAVLLAVDVTLAAIFGRRYLRWLAGLFPGLDRQFLESIINLPTSTLIFIGLLELALAAAFYNLGVFLSS